METVLKAIADWIKGILTAGASGIIRPGKNACQVIVGTKVKSIYDELDKLLK